MEQVFKDEEIEKATEGIGIFKLLGKLEDAELYDLCKQIPEEVITMLQKYIPDIEDRIQRRKKRDGEGVSRGEREFMVWYNKLKQSADKKVYAVIQGCLADDIICDMTVTFAPTTSVSQATTIMKNSIGIMRTTEFLSCYNFMVLGYQFDLLFEHWEKNWKSSYNWSEIVHTVTDGAYGVEMVRRYRQFGKLCQCFPRLLFADTSFHDIGKHLSRLGLQLQESDDDRTFWMNLEGLTELEMVLATKRKKIEIAAADRSKQQELWNYMGTKTSAEKQGARVDKARETKKKKAQEERTQKAMDGFMNRNFDRTPVNQIAQELNNNRNIDKELLDQGRKQRKQGEEPEVPLNDPRRRRTQEAPPTTVSEQQQQAAALHAQILAMTANFAKQSANPPNLPINESNDVVPMDEDKSQREENDPLENAEQFRKGNAESDVDIENSDREGLAKAAAEKLANVSVADKPVDPPAKTAEPPTKAAAPAPNTSKAKKKKK